MYTIKNFLENDDITVTNHKGNIRIVEYKKDLSVNPATCITQFFASKMQVRKKQALIELKDDSIIMTIDSMGVKEVTTTNYFIEDGKLFVKNVDTHQYNEAGTIDAYKIKG